jgi:hypothetical protein
MALDAHALVTLTEAKEELNISGTARDTALETAIHRATGMVEAYLDRQVVERVSGTVPVAYTEYHSLDESVEDIFLHEWPIVSVTSVAESSAWPRDYSTALVAGTDYSKNDKTARLTRLATGGVSTWQTGWRGVKVVYRGGYSALTSVPWPIRDVARRLAALLFKELDRGQHGITGYSDSIGNFTRLGTARLTDDMKAQLDGFRRTQPKAYPVERE